MHALWPVRQESGVTRAFLKLATLWAGGTLAAPALADVPSFRVQVAAGAEALAVEASFPTGSTGGALVLEDGGERYLRDLVVEQGGHWVPVGHGLGSEMCAKGCRLRYRFLLREAAAALSDPQA